jgi:hypothetical protein
MITLDLASGSAFSEHTRYRGTMISRIFSPCLYVKARFQFPDPAAPDEVLFRSLVCDSKQFNLED